jgi:hypothetical protein
MFKFDCSVLHVIGHCTYVAKIDAAFFCPLVNISYHIDYGTSGKFLDFSRARVIICCETKKSNECSTNNVNTLSFRIRSSALRVRGCAAAVSETREGP